MLRTGISQIVSAPLNARSTELFDLFYKEAPRQSSILSSLDSLSRVPEGGYYWQGGDKSTRQTNIGFLLLNFLHAKTFNQDRSRIRPPQDPPTFRFDIQCILSFGFTQPLSYTHLIIGAIDINNEKSPHAEINNKRLGSFSFNPFIKAFADGHMP